MKKTTLLTCLLLVLAMAGKAQHSRQTDSLALVALYRSAGGEGWRVNKNWLSNRPIDKWYGIATDPASGRVTKIHLEHNQLTGQLPEEILTLDSLTEPFFAYNQLSGYIPPLHEMKALYAKFGVPGTEYISKRIFEFTQYSLADIYRNATAFSMLSSGNPLIYVGLDGNGTGSPSFIRTHQGSDIRIDHSRFGTVPGTKYYWCRGNNLDTVTQTPIRLFKAFSSADNRADLWCRAQVETVKGKIESYLPNTFVSFAENTPPAIQYSKPEIDLLPGDAVPVAVVYYTDDLSDIDRMLCSFTYLPKLLDCSFSHQLPDANAVEPYWFLYSNPLDSAHFLSGEVRSIQLQPKLQGWQGTDSLVMECRDREGLSSHARLLLTIAEKTVPPVVTEIPVPVIKYYHFAPDGSSAYATWSAPDSIEGFIAVYSYSKTYDSDCNTIYQDIVIDSVYLPAGSDSVYFSKPVGGSNLLNNTIFIKISSVYNKTASEQANATKYRINKNVSMHIAKADVSWQFGSIYYCDMSWTYSNQCGEYNLLMRSENGGEFKAIRSMCGPDIAAGSFLDRNLRRGSSYAYYFRSMYWEEGDPTSDTVYVSTPNDPPAVTGSLAWYMQYRLYLLKKDLATDDSQLGVIWKFAPSADINVRQTADSIILSLKDTAMSAADVELRFTLTDSAGLATDTLAKVHVIKTNTPIKLSQGYPPMINLMQLEEDKTRSIIDIGWFFTDSETPRSQYEYSFSPSTGAYRPYIENTVVSNTGGVAQYGKMLYIEIPNGAPLGPQSLWVYAEDQMGARDSLNLKFEIVRRQNQPVKISDIPYYKQVSRSAGFPPIYLPSMITDDRPIGELKIWTDIYKDSVWTEEVNDTLYFRNNKTMLLPGFDVENKDLHDNFNMYLYAQDAEGERDSLLLHLSMGGECPKMINKPKIKDIFFGDTLAYCIKDYYSDDLTTFENTSRINLHGIAKGIVSWMNTSKDTIFMTPAHNRSTATPIRGSFDIIDQEFLSGYFTFDFFLQPARSTAPVFAGKNVITVVPGGTAEIDLADYFTDDYTPTYAMQWDVTAGTGISVTQDDDILSIVFPANFSGSESVSVTAKDIGGLSATGTLTFRAAPLPVSVNISKAACGGYSFAGINRTASGIYKDTLKTVSGADSIIVLTLTVNPVYNLQASKSVAFGQTYQFGSQLLAKNGSYTETFQSVNGCDSTVTLAFTVLPNSAPHITMSVKTFSLAENSAMGTIITTITADDSEDADLVYSISGSAAFTIDPATGAVTVKDSALLDYESAKSLTFTVRVSDGTAYDEVEITVTLTDVVETGLPMNAESVIIFPNTFSDRLSISATAFHGTVLVTAQNGAEVYSAKFGGYTDINTRNWPAGKYTVSIVSGSQVYAESLIKE